MQIPNLIFAQNILPFEGEVYLYENFIDSNDEKSLFQNLKSEINWKQEGMKMYGKDILFPRLTAWYSDPDKTYKYSGLTNVPQVYSPNLLEIKQLVEKKVDLHFNSALLNYYRSGTDSMGWHADNETELGLNPIIASVSLGESRRFQFKHKTIPKTLITITLPTGSLLMMQGATQHNWVHQIPKTKFANERINITFRTIF